MTETLQKFKDYLEVLAHYEHVVTQLQWDMQTQTPKKGYDNKVEVMTYFSSEVFRMQTAEEYEQMLNALSEESVFEQLDEGMQVTVKRRKKSFEEDKRIPKDFYEEMVRACAHSEKAWEEAKEKEDFELFAPHLQKMIDYSRQLVGYTKPDMDAYD
ncbi:MAG: carboxypeptidase M32, partial [Lachnospiraceae bacterium]|nr:carboxypeptidase M32 [Lachnospiraceae bacterium]